MTRLFIPAPGTRLTLAADWKCSVERDWRNRDLTTPLERRLSMSDELMLDVTIPAGAVIKVDSYSLKRGADPATHELAVVLCGREVPVKVNGHVIKRSCRFYVALSDINQIEFGGMKSSHSILS
ncbi:hypothetical protein [Paraburkholderia sp.]|uniref:hypothetical protein n=1 Tax=Paraburkholderia sp. TaxID=1926495 RepID=UPI0039E3FD75